VGVDVRHHSVPVRVRHFPSSLLVVLSGSTCLI
jgi:hypothetical protein